MERILLYRHRQNTNERHLSKVLDHHKLTEQLKCVST